MEPVVMVANKIYYIRNTSSHISNKIIFAIFFYSNLFSREIIPIKTYPHINIYVGINNNVYFY
jgi:hypothetical protein